MAEFLHERRIGLEMLDEMEEMRRDVEEGAFQLPAAFRDDVELTSNMMRLKSMESERKFRDKERSKLVKWIGYSDNFEKIYDDPDFSTIKEKARERQALKDLENAGNPEIARQLEAKRKAEEEALHRARTSSAALARAAKARWAQVPERMAATADRKQEARTARLAQIAELARQKELEASSSSEGSYEEGSSEEESGEESSRGDRRGRQRGRGGGRAGGGRHRPGGYRRGGGVRGCEQHRRSGARADSGRLNIITKFASASRRRRPCRPARVNKKGVPPQRAQRELQDRLEIPKSGARAAPRRAMRHARSCGMADCSAPAMWGASPSKARKAAPAQSIMSSKGSRQPSETTTGTAPWSSTSKKRYENREWPRGTNPKVAFVNNSEYGKSASSLMQHAIPSSASSQSLGRNSPISYASRQMVIIVFLVLTDALRKGLTI